MVTTAGMDDLAVGGAPLRQRLRAPARRRVAGLVLALALEALLVLAMLTLGEGKSRLPEGDDRPLATFDLAAPMPEKVTPREVRKEESRTEAAAAKPVTPTTAPPAPPIPSEVRVPEPVVQLPSPVMSLPAEQMAQSDLRNLPSPPSARGPSGPPAPKGESDTPLVEGRGPNGERLYAASWYREPYDSELKGYLSTAQPGWALIACRTVPDYKVDDCVAVDEHPSHSQLARAVLAAAWQFKVRPPRVGGQVKVGEWVRIRIDYGLKPERRWN
ncbi:hypothetical protein GCM10022280_27460 [Sphingomonas swuensis]|uniref:Protein TonB n=1 Tax=Sphingomonas swuensis TaxID=977800 RepID=A0ABP7TG57_9SPHN